MVAMALPVAAGLVCEAPEYGFGEASASDTIEHTFTLRNTGTDTIRIRGVRTTCGCSTTDMTQRELAPGETSALTARIALRGRMGAQRFVLWVRSDDAVNPLLMLLIHGSVLLSADTADKADIADVREDGPMAIADGVDASDDLVVRPQVITLPADGASATQRLVLVVYSQSSTPFSIEDVRGPAGVTIQVRGGLPHRYLVTLSDLRADAGNLDAPVVIRTSSGQTLTVPLAGAAGTPREQREKGNDP